MNRLRSVAPWGIVATSADERWLGTRLAFVALCVIAVSLSACTSPPPSVLTIADIPSYLGVKPNASASVEYASRVNPPSHCRTTGVAVFSVPAKPLDEALLPASSQAPVVSAVDWLCSKKGPSSGWQISSQNEGMGGGGWYLGVIWSQGDRMGAITVAGPVGDRRLSMGLADMLARRAAARA